MNLTIKRGASSSSVSIPIDETHSKNMFTSNPKNRGQPTVSLPGTHEFMFSVVLDGNKITWMIKEDNAARQQVDASSSSQPARRRPCRRRRPRPRASLQIVSTLPTSYEMQAVWGRPGRSHTPTTELSKFIKEIGG